MAVLKSAWGRLFAFSGVFMAASLQGLTGLARADDAATAPSAAPVKAASTRPAQTPVLAANTVLHADVPYGGPDPSQDVLDIYAPAKAAAAPVILFIHGGEWSRGDKKEISYKPQFFNEHGVLFVSANYRLSPKDKHPAQVDDIATAIAWVYHHISEYGGNPHNIFLLGHSAGCHLVTLVALDPQPLAKVGLTPSVLRGVAAWSGSMYDLVDAAKTDHTYGPFIKATFGEDEPAQRAASPVTYVQNAKGGPVFLFGSVDDAKATAARQATDLMVNGIRAAGGRADTAVLAGKSHFTANHEIGAPGDKSGQILLDFVLKASKANP